MELEKIIEGIEEMFNGRLVGGYRLYAYESLISIDDVSDVDICIDSNEFQKVRYFLKMMGYDCVDIGPLQELSSALNNRHPVFKKEGCLNIHVILMSNMENVYYDVPSILKAKIERGEERDYVLVSKVINRLANKNG